MVYERIKNVREDNDLKQIDLAKRLSCSQSNYSRYENGEIVISPEILVLIAEIYDVSTDYLLNRTDKKEINR